MVCIGKINKYGKAGARLAPLPYKRLQAGASLGDKQARFGETSGRTEDSAGDKESEARHANLRDALRVTTPNT